MDGCEKERVEYPVEKRNTSLFPLTSNVRNRVSSLLSFWTPKPVLSPRIHGNVVFNKCRRVVSLTALASLTHFAIIHPFGKEKCESLGKERVERERERESAQGRLFVSFIIQTVSGAPDKRGIKRERLA